MVSRDSETHEFLLYFLMSGPYRLYVKVLRIVKCITFRDFDPSWRFYTSQKCKNFFFVFKIILKQKNIAIWLRKRHFSIWKCELQCKKWYETYIFYFTIVFVTPNPPQKISLRVSIASKKNYQTISFVLSIMKIFKNS